MTGQDDLRGRVRVPADLDTVTAIGDEDHSGIDPAAVERIWQAARHWYQAGMHPAIQVCVRHDGKVVLNRAIGHGWGNAPTDPADAEKIPVKTDTPFCVYSSAKAITATVVHMLVERGQLLTRRPGLRVHPDVHQPRQGPHHHPARDHPQRRRPVSDRTQAGPQAGRRSRVRARTTQQPAAAVPAGARAHLPRTDLGPADARNRLRRNG